MEKTSVLGIDFGTSGCRGVVLREDGECLAEAAVPLPPSQHNGAAVEQSPAQWWQALETLIPKLLQGVERRTLRSLALDATSGTVLLGDDQGNALTPALMYNDNRATAQAKRIAEIAPRECAAHGTGSGLAKALWLLDGATHKNVRIYTQADWLSTQLCGRAGVCDANNVLKLGYDPITRCWPEWLEKLGVERRMLPAVVDSGTPLGTLLPELAERWGLRSDLIVCAGTTDSTAAFIAAGAEQPGEAVTSLGSTLVLKIIAEKPLFAPEYGIYSQPLGEHWLVGGGSNSGGAVLRRYFSDEEMAALSRELDAEQDSGLDYYPLPAVGERFPLNDPELQPRLTPRPDSDVQFFQGLLEGIAAIEKQGYDKLHELGAPYPSSVRSNGGGANNPAWTAIRERLLGVPMLEAEQREACYGAARLALTGLDSQDARFW